jgi:hypothetical protein
MPGGFASFAFVIVMLTGLMLFLSFGVLIAAYLLQFACKMATVPVPDIDRAVFISCVEAMFGSIILLLAGIAPEYPAIDMSWPAAAVVLSTVAVTFVIPTAIHVLTMRVSFLKAMLIALLRYSLSLSLLAVLRFLFMLANGPL